MVKVIDATDMILGRLCSHIAKRLLLGEQIVVLNAEKAVLVGNKENIINKYKERGDRGHRYKGPFFPKAPHRILKRTVRGMVPWKRKRGRAAMRRLKVHLGVPEEFKNSKTAKFDEFKVNVGKRKTQTLEDIGRALGWTPRA